MTDISAYTHIHTYCEVSLESVRATWNLTAWGTRYNFPCPTSGFVTSTAYCAIIEHGRVGLLTLLCRFFTTPGSGGFGLSGSVIYILPG